jgi:hypothetical protein
MLTPIMKLIIGWSQCYVIPQVVTWSILQYSLTNNELVKIVQYFCSFLKSVSQQRALPSNPSDDGPPLFIAFDPKTSNSVKRISISKGEFHTVYIYSTIYLIFLWLMKLIGLCNPEVKRSSLNSHASYCSTVFQIY